MVQVTPDVVDSLRESWGREWLRASAGPAAERSAMLDRYARLHATSQLLDSDATADLLDDPFGQALTAGVVRRILGSEVVLGSAVPILAGAGEESLRVERSRPGWHLTGTVQRVAWPAGVDRLAVFAIDEGDNDVLALLATDTPRVEITPSASRQDAVNVHFADVTVPAVTHCAGEPAALSDGLTVLAMAELIAAAARLLERAGGVNDSEQAELRLCRASLRAAAASVTSARVVRRQHDVSAAALLVLPTCLRLAEAAEDQDDPEVAKRVRLIREAVRTLPVWHRERLAALV